MIQVAEILKDAGASFYAEIEDFPEIGRLRLVSASTDSDEIIPPADQLIPDWLR